jgi:pilus assembly protein FimV
MHMSRCVSSSSALVVKTKPLVGALAAALLACSTSYAASLGHSRIVSALGQPLRIDVPITQLSTDDLRTLAVRPAPAADWKQAGLTPPVDLATLQLRLVDGYTPGTRILQLRSSQAFDRSVADLLLDIRTASGQQRYQVSLLAQAGPESLAAQSSSSLRTSGQSAGAQGAAQQAPQRVIHVKPGDTMFAIALRNAVPGVSVYQMMIALQRANPQAFIQKNVNLVKAGATLSMPGMAALTAISDKEARRIFQKQAQAFALYRQRLAGSTSAVGQEAGAAASGKVSAASPPAPQESAQGAQDQLRLSGSNQAASGGRTAGTGTGGSDSAGGTGDAASLADDRVATSKGIQDSEQRVSQLEENVRHLNQALQSQGGAATDLVVGGVKGLGQTLADAANAVTGTSSDSAPSGSSPQADKPAASAATADGGKTGGSTGSGATGNLSGGQGGAAPGSVPGNGASGAADHAAKGAAAAAGTGTPNSAAGSSSTGQLSDAPAGAAGGDGGPGSGASQAGSSTAGGSGASAAAGAAANGKTVQDNSAAPGSSDNNPANGATPNNAAANGAAANGATANGAAASGATANSGSAANNAGGASAPKPGASAQAGNSASERASAANGAAQTDSTKAEQTVSWLQEHMLGVITGVLAFIVLIIAWLLRRANSGRDDDTHGVITETMVKEKLEQINLDLEQDPGSRSGRS